MANRSLSFIFWGLFLTSTTNAQEFVAARGVKDLKAEVAEISLLKEDSVQTKEPDFGLFLAIGLGSVRVPQQSFTGKGGLTGNYAEQERPQISGRLTWLPFNIFDASASLGLALSIDYFSVEQETLALHFMPLGVGPQIRIPVGSHVALNFGYDFINVYREQVGLTGAAASDWSADSRLRGGFDLALDSFGIGDQYSQYNLGAYYQNTGTSDQQSASLQVSVSL